MTLSPEQNELFRGDWVFDRDAMHASMPDLIKPAHAPNSHLAAEWPIDSNNQTDVAPLVLAAWNLTGHEPSGSPLVTAHDDSQAADFERAPSSTIAHDTHRILSTLYQKWNETFPRISDLARSKLQTEIKARTGIDLDPDRTYFMRFDSAQSNPDTITGWAHVGKPEQENTLTTCLFTNFPASAVEHAWVLDQLSGIYTENSTEAGRFDSKNEVRIKPSLLMKIVRDIDFFEFARCQLERAWRLQHLQIIHDAVSLVANLASPTAALSATDANCVLQGAEYLDNKAGVHVYLFDVNGYVSTDMLVFADSFSGRIVLYMPRSSQALFSFVNEREMRQWVIDSCRCPDRRNAIAQHFSLYDRQDGTTYSGVDSWLSTLAGSQAEAYIQHIFSRKALILDRDIFRAMAGRQKVRVFSDLDIAVKSDSEVDRDRATLYFDALNAILPNPVTPLVSFGLHMDAAINGDSPEERAAGMAGVLSDSANIALMAVQAGVERIFEGGLSLDSEAFHTRVRENLHALSQARTIEWMEGQWVANADTSPQVSNELRKSVTSDMYTLEMTEAQLALPDRMGRREAADGKHYIKIDGNYLEVEQWAGAPNRYAIIDQGRRVPLRFDADQFRLETTAERLEILIECGLGGRGSKLAFGDVPRADDVRGAAGNRPRDPALAMPSWAHPTDYVEPLSGARHSALRNGEAVFTADQQATLQRLSVHLSSGNTYRRISNNNPGFYGTGKLYEVRTASGSPDAEPAYSVVEMNGLLVPTRENLVEGYASSYEIYALNAVDQPGEAVEWDGARWFFEARTSRQVSSELADRLRDVRLSGVNGRQLSSPDSMGLRHDARGLAYVKIDGRYIELKRFRYHGTQPLYGVATDMAPTITYAAGAFRLTPGSGWALAKVPLEVYSVPDDYETFVAMFEHWPSPTWRLRGGLRRAEADPRFHEVLVLTRRLKADATAFFKQLRQSSPAAVPMLAENAPDRQILETLFNSRDGIVIGEEHDKTAGVQVLIDNMEELKRLGVTTLYLEGFFADLSGAELEAYFAAPDAQMPAHTQQWADLLSTCEGLDPHGPYTKRELIRLAHAKGIEIRPLDCVASYFGPYFRLIGYQFSRTRLKMMNYFGAATIVQHRWARGGGKWVALVGASHINMKHGIAGLAELTGSFGIRVKDESWSTEPRIAPGHFVNLNIDSRYDYVWIRSRPREVPGPIPRLIGGEAQIGLRQVPLDRYALPDQPGWRELMADKVMEYRGLDRRYADSGASEQDHHLLEEFFRQRDALQADAVQFFDQLSYNAPPLPRTLPRSIDSHQPDINILDALLRKTTGVLLGESHNDMEAKQLLIDNMGKLKSAGVATLYLEHLLSDIHQTDLATYFRAPDALMPARLKAYLDDLSAGNEIAPDGRYTYYALVEHARRSGIKVIALDCTASYKVNDILPENPRARAQAMSYYASATIWQHQASNGNAKWVALVGNAHTNTFSGVPGVAELTDSISVRVEPDDTLLQPRLVPDDGKDVWDIRMGATRLRADYVWARPSVRSP